MLFILPLAGIATSLGGMMSGAASASSGGFLSGLMSFGESKLGGGILGGIAGIFSGRSARKAAKRQFEWVKELKQMEMDHQRQMVEDAVKRRQEHWQRWSSFNAQDDIGSPASGSLLPVPGLGGQGQQTPVGGGLGGGAAGGAGGLGNAWVGNQPQLPQPRMLPTPFDPM